MALKYVQKAADTELTLKRKITEIKAQHYGVKTFLRYFHVV